MVRATRRSTTPAASLTLLLGTALAAPAGMAAPLAATIGNGPDVNDGTYLNAGSLANTMAFTSVTLLADNSITVADPIDLSTSIFGPTVFDLFLQSPTVTIDGAVTMGPGNLYLNAGTINLNAEVRDSFGSLLDGSRIGRVPSFSGPLAVNVGGNGSVDQATAIANIGVPATVNLLGGDHADESLLAFGTLSATMSGGSVGGVSISSGGTVDWTGGQILAGVLHFSGTFNIYGGGFQVAPWGDCATTPEANWAAAPGQLDNQARCVRGIFADGSAFRTAVNSIGITNFVGVSVVPVPAAAWLLGSGLAVLGGLRRLRRA